MNTEKTKLTKGDLQRMQSRYDKKFEEYKLLDIEQLKEIHDNQKLSSTDNKALKDAALYIKMMQYQKLKEQQNPLVIEENKEGITITNSND